MSFNAIELGDTFSIWKDKINELGTTTDSLDVQNVKLTGTQSVAGAKTFTNQIIAAAGIASTGTITSNGSITLTSGNLSVNSGTLTVAGNTSLTNIGATGTLSVTGATSLTSLSVSGAASISSNAIVGGTLSVTGVTTLSSLTLAGSITQGGVTRPTDSGYSSGVHGINVWASTLFAVGKTTDNTQGRITLDVNEFATYNAAKTKTFSVNTTTGNMAVNGITASGNVIAANISTANGSFSGNVTAVGMSATSVSATTGTFTSITGLSDPTAASAAATKSYVDAILDSTKVKKFAENSNNGRLFYDALAFIDFEDNARVIGNSVSDSSSQYAFRFGATDAIAPASILSLPGAEKAAKLYSTYNKTFIISDAGNLYGMGENGIGQLGITGNVTSNIKYPTQANVSNVNKVIVSTDPRSYSTMTLTNTGSVYSFGKNQFGQLGTGDTVQTDLLGPRLTLGPGNTYGNPTGIVLDVVTAGGYNSTSTPETYCALLTGGTAWMVGYGGQGQMADGTNTGTNTLWKQVKTGVSTFLTGVVAVYAGGYDQYTSFYALTSSGELYGWGYNGHGNLGLGNTTNRNYATLISTLVTNVWVGSGDSAILFLKKTDNKIYAAGRNASGQLGIGNTSNAVSLTQVTALNSVNIEKVYVCASNNSSSTTYAKVVGDNTLYVTGYNSQGQLGLGNTTALNEFTRVNFSITSPILDIYSCVMDTIGGFVTILTQDGNTYFVGQSRWGIGSVTNGNRTMFTKNTNLIC